ncbi:MAG TPA: hypothetical protein VHU80_08600 [Polyangiaceae bacterium]|jgi:hypothetical protein|nr:hypothetical protein [Polyangiaceae bacterium]
MTPEQRKYLFVECVIGAAIINALINGGLGWAATRGFTTFPVWKIPGVAADLCATAFGVSFGTCIGAAVQVRIDRKRGRITTPAMVPERLALIIHAMPRRLLARAIALGVASLAALGPFIALALFLSGSSELGRQNFIALKAAFSALEGAAVTPIIVLAALLDPRTPAQSPS